MAKDDLNHLNFVDAVHVYDKATIERKERVYQGSWKKRGGRGAFFTMARKWDALEKLVEGEDYEHDIFYAAVHDGEGDGTVLDQIRDLRVYLTLIEAELRAEGGVGAVLATPTARAPLATPALGDGLSNGGGSYARERAMDDGPNYEAPNESGIWPLVCDNIPMSQSDVYQRIWCGRQTRYYIVRQAISPDVYRLTTHQIQEHYAAKDGHSLVWLKKESVARVEAFLASRPDAFAGAEVGVGTSDKSAGPTDPLNYRA
jgi:hypothetical protein